MYYEGVLRQKGGGMTEGLRRIFGGLTRHMFVPMLKKMVRHKADQLKQNALKAGVGLMSDVAKRKNFKQALQSRGKRLLSDVLNTSAAPRKRQKQTSSRPVKNSSSRRGRGRPRKKTKQPRNPDIFD